VLPRLQADHRAERRDFVAPHRHTIEHVVVAVEQLGVLLARQLQAGTPRVVMDQEVVARDVLADRIAKQQPMTRAAWLDDDVVLDQHALGAPPAVAILVVIVFDAVGIPEGDDATRHVAEDEVVAHDAVLHAVQVDRGAALASIAVDDIALDQRLRGDAIDRSRILARSGLAGVVGVDLDPARDVVVDPVVANDHPVAAVREVHAVLGQAAECLVVLDDHVIDKAGKHAPVPVWAEDPIAHLDVRAVQYREPGPRGAARP